MAEQLTINTMYRAGLKRHNLKTDKNEFVVYEQLLKPNPNPKSTQESFVQTGKNGVISHKQLIDAGFTGDIIADLVQREVLHVIKPRINK